MGRTSVGCIIGLAFAGAIALACSSESTPATSGGAPSEAALDIAALGAPCTSDTDCGIDRCTSFTAKTFNEQRCASRSPCDYVRCPSGTECSIALSSPVQVGCALANGNSAVDFLADGDDPDHVKIPVMRRP